MKATKAQVNPKVTAAIKPGNLPAGGKYSTGGTEAHLNTDFTVDWEGNMARLKLGFNLEGDGLASIFLMYGTPHHAPAAGLREALREDPKKISRKSICEAPPKKKATPAKKEPKGFDMAEVLGEAAPKKRRRRRRPAKAPAVAAE